MLKLNRKIKVLALAMATALAVALLPIHSVSANDFSWGADATFSADMFDSADWRSLFVYWQSFKSEHNIDYPYSVALCHDLRYWQNRTEMWGFTVSKDEIIGLGVNFWQRQVLRQILKWNLTISKPFWL